MSTAGMSSDTNKSSCVKWEPSFAQDILATSLSRPRVSYAYIRLADSRQVTRSVDRRCKDPLLLRGHFHRRHRDARKMPRTVRWCPTGGARQQLELGSSH